MKASSSSLLKGTLKLLLAICLGTLGGWAFWTLHSPLPWLLGSMVVCAVASIARLPVATPMAARPPPSATLAA